MATITSLLERLQCGDRSALDELSPLVYDELHRLAARHMHHERPNHTLQPTELVHEAWMRLVGSSHPEYHSRSQFYAIASHLMRQILVDYARQRNAGKRGGGVVVVPLAVGLDFSPERAGLVVALDDALRDLGERDPLKARLVEMRFFGGLTLEELAEAEASTIDIVRRELRLAHAWLHREIATGTAP